MLPLLFALAFPSKGPSLDDVYAKVQAMPGVHIRGEMVRPAVVAIEFKIAPGGRLWAKYPTSEQFVGPEETITWMRDRRQFSRAKSERNTPTPAGFESLWPNGVRMTQSKDAQAATFDGREAWEIPCQSSVTPDVRLFVEKRSWLPLGTVAVANGATYEIRYRSVKVGPLPPKDFRFVPPKDARPYKAVDPTADLPKPGATMPAFEAKDIEGRPSDMKNLLRGRKGLVVNFWFSACSGCMAELPALSKLGTEFSVKGIGFVGINPIDDARTARRTLKQHGIPFSTVVGKDAKRIADSVGVVAYPVTVVLDAGGQVVDTLPFFDEARLTKALKKVAGE
ncbi:MAG: redoxin domain-containing protein [Fimbriimonas sp.]